MNDPDDLRAQIEHHRAELLRLQRELDDTLPGSWQPPGFYLLYHIMVGLVLGTIGAAASLLWNVFGATLLLDDQSPLYLLQIYLTFGMGERALDPETQLNFALFTGFFLYLGTGAAYGVVLELVIRTVAGSAPWIVKFIVANLVGLAIWAVNFLILLPWLQPLLFDGNWIAEMIPVPVSLSTHLVFASAFALFVGWGRFDRTRELAPGAALRDPGALEIDEPEN